MSYGFRMLLKWARWVHVYLTMFGFLLILFFAVTGFILNHPEWFDYGEEYKSTVTGSVPTNLLQDPQKNNLAIVETLRKHFGAGGEMTGFELQEDEEKEIVFVSFKSFERKTEAKIQRADGQAKVVHSSQGILGLLTGLHRGDAGEYRPGLVWSFVIDGVAILLLVVSLTGLVLWSSLRSRGQHGLALMGLGALVCGVIYFLFVP